MAMGDSFTEGVGDWEPRLPLSEGLALTIPWFAETLDLKLPKQRSTTIRPRSERALAAAVHS